MSCSCLSCLPQGSAPYMLNVSRPKKDKLILKGRLLNRCGDVQSIRSVSGDAAIYKVQCTSY